jgi:hypothetical protein
MNMTHKPMDNPKSSTVSSSKTKQTSSRTWEDNFIGLDTQHCLQAEIQQRLQLKLTEQRRDCAKKQTDLWKATLLITNSNPNKFDQLEELHTITSAGTRQLPHYIQQRHNRLNQHKSYGNVTIVSTQEGSSFAKGQTTPEMTAAVTTIQSESPIALRRLDRPC